MKYLLSLLILFFFSGSILSQNGFILGDTLPDAPALSKRGDYKVGVRTLEFINKDQIDILNVTEDHTPLYDRHLKVEIWYPSRLKEGEQELVIYDQVMGMNGQENRPLIPFQFEGRAARNADIIENETFPLIIVSHGYPGSRLLMTYLTENLASKGYVVAAIDHLESTFKDAAKFQSTLLNRPKDILFVLNELVNASKENDHFLSSKIEENNIGIIGYSMGGYGVLNVAGAGYSEKANDFFKNMTSESSAFESLVQGNPKHFASFDSRIKAVVAFAPWGQNAGVWDEEGLKGLRIPTFFIAGNQDDISGYENGIKLIFEGAKNVERYMLTYDNARHNVAPNAPVPETMAPGLHFDEYYRYAEPAWDERMINNINQHFVTAFLGTKLKGLDYQSYLDVQENSNDKTWKGFKNRTGTGLELLKGSPE